MQSIKRLVHAKNNRVWSVKRLQDPLKRMKLQKNNFKL